MGNSPRFEHLRRNMSLLIFDSTVFHMGAVLIHSSIVIPDFVSRLTTNEIIIGLASSLAMLFWAAPQLLFSYIVGRSKRPRLFFMRPSIPSRVAIIVLGLLIASLNAQHSEWILLAFFVCYGAFYMTDAMVTIAWAEMLGTLLPVKMRSVMFGLSLLLVSVLTLGMREVLLRILSPQGPPFPQNFALLFFLAGIFFVLGAIALNLLRPERHLSVDPVPVPPRREFLAYIGKILREDHDFRNFTLMRLVFDLSTLAAPFYILLGTDYLKLANAVLISDSIVLLTIGNVLASLLLSWAGQRYGSRMILLLCGLFNLLAIGSALVAALNGQVAALHFTFFALGVVQGMLGPAYFDWVITHAPHNTRPIYIGVTNTLSTLGNLAPVLGGFILRQSASYPLLFIIACVVAVTGILMTLRLAEPRHNLDGQTALTTL